MRYDELIGLVKRSSCFDWIWHDERGIAVFKPNVNISIHARRDDDDEPFEEEWAMKFPNARATKMRFDLYLGPCFVKDYYFVSVDGGRAALPYPAIGTMSITNEQFAVAEAVNPHSRDRNGYYRRYIDRFEVLNEEEHPSIMAVGSKENGPALD